MTETINIYGRELTLEPFTEPDGIVTDILILARVVYPDDESEYQECVLKSHTQATTPMIENAMLRVATLSNESGWMHDDEE